MHHHPLRSTDLSSFGTLNDSAAAADWQLVYDMNIFLCDDTAWYAMLVATKVSVELIAGRTYDAFAGTVVLTEVILRQGGSPSARHPANLAIKVRTTQRWSASLCYKETDRDIKSQKPVLKIETVKRNDDEKWLDFRGLVKAREKCSL